jgi:hypothetical protein
MKRRNQFVDILNALSESTCSSCFIFSLIVYSSSIRSSSEHSSTSTVSSQDQYRYSRRHVLPQADPSGGQGASPASVPDWPDLAGCPVGRTLQLHYTASYCTAPYHTTSRHIALHCSTKHLLHPLIPPIIHSPISSKLDSSLLGDTNSSHMTYDMGSVVRCERTSLTRYSQFIQSQYPSIKSSNPDLKVLIREAAGIEPRAFVRFGESVWGGLYLVSSYNILLIPRLPSRPRLPRLLPVIFFHLSILVFSFRFASSTVRGFLRLVSRRTLLYLDSLPIQFPFLTRVPLPASLVSRLPLSSLDSPCSLLVSRCPSRYETISREWGKRFAFRFVRPSGRLTGKWARRIETGTSSVVPPSCRLAHSRTR